MTKHERLVQVLTEQDAVSRGKDDESTRPQINDPDAFMRNLKARYAKTPPTPIVAAPPERTYQTLAEGLDAPTLPPAAYHKFLRAVRA